MSVLLVFGQNLRALCRAHSSQANVAQALGINKVQFHRYLTGTSFPKPNLLKTVCDYFGVDARILTDPLAPDHLSALERQFRTGQKTTVAGLSMCDPALAALHRALEYAARGNSYVPDSSDLKDGLYYGYKNSMAYPGKIAVQVYQIKTLGGARVFRGFEPKAMFPPDHRFTGDGERRPRELRGMVLSAREGHVIMALHSPPAQWIEHIFLSANSRMNDGSFTGFVTFGRREHTGVNRMARCLWQPVGKDCPALLKAARIKTWLTFDEVNSAVRHALSDPLG